MSKSSEINVKLQLANELDRLYAKQYIGDRPIGQKDIIEQTYDQLNKYVTNILNGGDLNGNECTSIEKTKEPSNTI